MSPNERILVMLSRHISVSAVAAVGLVIVERPCRHTALAAAIGHCKVFIRQ